MWQHAADVIRVMAKSWSLLVALAVTVPCVVASAGAGTSPISMSVHAHTGIRLADVVWTGTRFLYVENTTNVVWAAGPRLTKFASMPKIVEETRCRLSPGTHGFSAGAVYCHAPDNVIYRISASGKVNVFARLPDTTISDGALAFDTFGAFGFRLLAATGRSGAANVDGGVVYAVAASGAVSRIGAYSSSTHGGADQMIVAPPGFGTGARQVVLTVDPRPSRSARDDGCTRTYARDRDPARRAEPDRRRSGNDRAGETRCPTWSLRHRHEFHERLLRIGGEPRPVCRGSDRRDRAQGDLLGGGSARSRVPGPEDPDDAAGQELQSRRSDVRGRLDADRLWRRAGVSRRRPAR